MTDYNSKECAYPILETETGINFHPGLTKREAIAKDLPKTDIEFGSTEDACEFIGQLEIPTSTIEMIRLSFAVEAKTRVMRADALLKELAK